MAKKQLAALFICSLIVFTVGSGLVPLLPIYAGRLGADSILTGYYLSFAFLALAISSVSAGWLSNRFQRRKSILMVSGLLMVPTAWLMGQVTSFLSLSILTALLWFLAGIVITTTNILTGLFVEKSERGRVFGIIGLAAPLGGILGGLASGAIVDRWGYPALFTLDALLYLLLPLFGLLLTDKPAAPKLQKDPITQHKNVMVSRAFLFLFFASILAHIANSQIVLGRSLIMDSHSFDATAISGSGAIGSIISLPFPVFIGWLSDRLGRKPLIMICYLASLIGLAVLASASDLWHFWIAMALQSIIGAGVAVGSALITDLVPRDSLATPLSWYGATQFIGYVVGFGGMGTVINWVGLTTSLMIGIILCLLALLLLVIVPRPTPIVQIEAG
ncbi:MAG: MFS transporter [Anaerolineaceae bacterium]|nr:MFS transporter [Anaerolineaceae bacterium]